MQGRGDGGHMARQRLDLKEAAERLGTSVDAVRKRVQRGSLDSEKGEDGRVYVWLDTGQTQPEVEGTALIEELRDEVRYLREQLDAEREARTDERRRHDTLMAQLMQGIPELGAPREQPEAPREAEEQQGRSESPPDAPGAQEGAQRRSWWRRVFGR